jgi:putative DNA methylase
MRLVNYGYGDYRELFNARQQLHLALLGREISRLKSPLREAMAIAFSDHLTTNNMMCGYAGGWRRLTPLFSIRAYRHIARPVEINPWLRHNGRGTFPNAVRAVLSTHRWRPREHRSPSGYRGEFSARLSTPATRRESGSPAQLQASERVRRQAARR